MNQSSLMDILEDMKIVIRKKVPYTKFIHHSLD